MVAKDEMSWGSAGCQMHAPFTPLKPLIHFSPLPYPLNLQLQGAHSSLLTAA